MIVAAPYYSTKRLILIKMFGCVFACALIHSSWCTEHIWVSAIDRNHTVP